MDVDVPHPDTPIDDQGDKINPDWWRALKLATQTINKLQADVTALTARVAALENP